MTAEMRKEILLYSYWEHFKKAKDLALVLPVNHPDRAAIEKEMQLMQELINQTNN